MFPFSVVRINDDDQNNDNDKISTAQSKDKKPV